MTRIVHLEANEIAPNQKPGRPRRVERISAAGDSQSGHKPVLLGEVLAALRPESSGIYIDGTFGGGGHTREILDASFPEGVVLGLDADEEAIARGASISHEPGIGSRLRLVQTNFSRLAEVARIERLAPVDGVLLDLGLSSFQLGSAERGFSFSKLGPLDMRFDRSIGQPASDLVNELPPDELMQILWRFGEEPKARRIVDAIVRERETAPIETTEKLAEIVSGAVGGRRGSDTHPATRTFQALRIATNRELESLEEALRGAVNVLKPGGRLAVISFHSLEDRIVKQFIKFESATCICPPEQPVCTCDHQPTLAPIGKAIKPREEEVRINPRSRSAILRVAERLPMPSRDDARQKRSSG